MQWRKFTIISFADSDAITQKKQTILGEQVAAVLAEPVTGFEKLYGGRNSQVYKVQTEAGQTYVVKVYFRHPADSRDRLGTEFLALQFMRRHGVTAVPQPIIADYENGWAMYEYIEGAPFAPADITTAEIDAAGQFLGTLARLRNRPEAQKFSAAAEACFSVAHIEENLQKRLARFTQIPLQTPPYQALRLFLQDSFLPLLDEVRAWGEAQLKLSGCDAHTILPQNRLTLSPSDFGFHNALKRADGQMVFLDFEYFGWDDPAKMIIDFILHPAMPLPDHLARHFVAAMLRCFAADTSLPCRLNLLYPYWGLKWCLIFLNEFVPEQMFRHKFAHHASLQLEQIQMMQLEKAQNMLHRVKTTYRQNFWVPPVKEGTLLEDF